MSEAPTDRIPLVDAEAALTSSMRSREPVRSLARLLRPYRGRLAGAGVAFIVKDSPTWVLPPVTAAIIDVVVAGGPLWRIALWGGLALGLLALNYPFAMIVVRMTSTAIRSVAYVVRAGLAARLQRFSLGAHNRQSAAIVQTKIVRDVENIELMLAQVMPTGLSALATIVGAVVVTALRVPSFVLVFALTIPAAAALVVGVRRRAARRNEHFRREVEGLAAQANEMAALLPITRGHGLEEVAATRVADRAAAVRRAGLSLDLLNGRFGALSWLTYQVLGLACLVVAAALSVTGILPISAGDVVLVSTYFTLLTNAVVMLLNIMPVLSKGMDAVRSIGDVAEQLDIEDTRGLTDPGPLRGDVELVGVTVRFTGSARPALDRVDLRVRAGETVAFVGPSGSGKSTIVNVVLGFVAPVEGTVRVDGHDLRSLDLTAMRRSVSIVPQETVLLNGTVRENVAYGRADLDDRVIREALRDADALDIIEGAEDGLDAPVGERGSRLSGGQRQRLSIARALARSPRLLVMDEATSALDAASEAQVGEAIDRASAGRTTLIVAHRLATVRHADRIVVVEGGRIVEQGTHEQLVAASGAYARLWAAA